jgi:hypothetical protein
MRKDRNLFVAAADGAKDGQRGAFIELVLAFEVPVQKDRYAKGRS